MELIIEILIMFVLIILNGFFSFSEIAILSVRKPIVKQLANEGNKQAKNVLQLIEEPEQFLSAIQIGITFIGILTGLYGGTMLSFELEKYVINWNVPLQYAQLVSLFVSVILITYFTLVLGEIVPKRLALSNPEKIAYSVAKSMIIFLKITSPLVTILSFTTNIVLKFFNISSQKEFAITEEEIKIMIAQGKEQGIFLEIEQNMIHKIFHLSDTKVKSLITPRNKVVWIDSHEDEKMIYEKITGTLYDYYPVCNESLDNIAGVLKTRYVLDALIKEKKINVIKYCEPALLIGGNTLILSLLTQFKINKTQFAIVIDEHGTVEGIITSKDINDVVYADIYDQSDDEEPKIKKRKDKSLLINASISIDEFMRALKITSIHAGEREGINTLGGFFIKQLGKMPKEGDVIQWKKYELEIMDMDGKRIDKILLSEVKK